MFLSTRSPNPLAITMAASGLGLMLFLLIGLPRSEGWVRLTFLVMCCGPYVLGWLHVVRLQGRWAAIVGVVFLALFLAEQAYQLVYLVRHNPTRVLIALAAIPALLALARFPTAPAQFVRLPFSPSTWPVPLYVLAAGAHLSGQTQLSAALGFLLGAFQLSLWFALGAQGTRWSRRLFALTLASVIPVAMSVAVPIGHALAVPYVSVHMIGIYLLWDIHLRATSAMPVD